MTFSHARIRYSIIVNSTDILIGKLSNGQRSCKTLVIAVDNVT